MPFEAIPHAAEPSPVGHTFVETVTAGAAAASPAFPSSARTSSRPGASHSAASSFVRASSIAASELPASASGPGIPARAGIGADS